LAYRKRRVECVRPRKLREDTALYTFVRDKLLYRYWSPQQIAAKLRDMHPDDPSWHVSHETIYAAIYAYPKGALKKEMIAALRQAKPARGRVRRSGAGKGALSVPEALRIQNRPEDVAERKLPGHWEGDLIKGAFNRSAVGTLVERKTRFIILCKMKDATAEAALESFTRQMKKVPALLRESLTYDRGSEMARHEELANRLNMTIWFADPYSPWQRGSNENSNGLLRQFLPKGTDLSKLSQIQLNDIARLLNTRPRQTLNWKTPEESMAQELDEFQRCVALDS
jgi:IS30 family transposase